MIKIIIKDDLHMFINGDDVVVSQKKLRAIIAFFAIEGIVSRDVVANIFFEGKKNNIRNSVYLINKHVCKDFIINIDRHTIGINPRLDVSIDVSCASLSKIVLKSERFILWKNKFDKSMKYYVHNELLTTILYNLKNTDNNCFIYGENGTGKTEFMLQANKSIDFCKTVFLECSKQETNFSLNIIFLILKNLQSYLKKDILKVFRDFSYNNFEAFKDDNNLLNLHYMPIRKLISDCIENNISDQFIVFIEDVEYIDKASLSIIEKLVRNQNCSLKFVFSSSSEEMNFEHTNKYVLSNWTMTQLQSYLTETHPSYIDMTTEIYLKTDGNAYQVNEYINQLSNDLKVKETNNFEYLSDVQKNIVSFCSCFIRSIPISYIKNVFFVSEDVIEELITYNLFYYRKIDGEQHLLFIHRSLKKYVYESLDCKDKEQNHLIIAAHLESIRTRGNIIEVNEIYYHYTKTSNISKQFEYRIKYLSIVSSYTYSLFPITNRFDFITDNSAYNFNLSSEIKELEKVVKGNVILNTNLEVLIDYYTLRNRYDIITGNYEGVMENIINHIECCIKLNNKQELLKSYYIMIYFGLNFGSTELIGKYLKKTDSITPLSTNPVAKRIEGYNYALQNNFDKAIFVINEAIELSSNLPKELAEANLVACYAYLGEIYIITKNYKRGLKDLSRGRKIVDDSLSYISGSILIDLFRAICYYHTNDKRAFKLIKHVKKQYDNSNLCWKRSLCYMYYKLITRRDIQNDLANCKIKYHSIYEKTMYSKIN